MQNYPPDRSFSTLEYSEQNNKGLHHNDQAFIRFYLYPYQSLALADARQLLTNQHIQNTPSPQTRLQSYTAF